MCYADFTCLHVFCVHACLQEYGITTEEKLHIAQNYCSPFLRKIRSDFLQVINSSTEDSTTRLDSRYSFCVVGFFCVCLPQCKSYCYRGVHCVQPFSHTCAYCHTKKCRNTHHSGSCSLTAVISATGLSYRGTCLHST